MKRLSIAIGEKYNYLTVIKEVTVGKSNRRFRCRCDCGNIKDVLLTHLIRSKIMSCGCYRKEINTKHGLHESREYSSWENMVQRCTNPKSKGYERYGGANITICTSWLKSFQSFYDDMGPRPNNTSIDRIDGTLGYFKENCKWSTPREQVVNVSRFNQYVKHHNVLKTIEEWILILDISRELFKSRISRGLGYKESLFGDIDVVTLDVSSKQQVVYKLSKFLSVSGFKKDEILELTDSDHEEPFHGYLVRYLIDFKGWPEKYLK